MFPLLVSGQKVFISFTGTNNSGLLCYSTEDVAVQKAIEDSLLFKEGKIKIEVSLESSKKGKEKGKALKEFPDVKTLQEAVAILKDNYGSENKDLLSPDMIKKQAELKGIGFPNLISN